VTPVPAEDVRRVADYMAASLLLSGLRLILPALKLILRKGILEPLATRTGEEGLKRMGQLLGRWRGGAE
jgi:hypothetical protein